MEISKKNRIAMLAAILWAVLVSLFVIFAFSEGKNPYGPISVIHHGSFAFYLVIAGLFIKATQKDIILGFKGALQYTVIVGVGGSMLFLLFSFIYLNVTWDTNFPIYLENMTDFFESMKNSGEMEKIGEVDKKGMSESIAKLKTATAWNIAFTDFGVKMIISLILSFIIAVIIRK